MSYPSSLHVLGAGAIGLLHAHRFSHRIATTLLLRPHTYDAYIEAGAQITLYDERTAQPQCLSVPAEALTELQLKPITTLLLCTKAHDTAAALEAVRHRLQPKTNIILLQNGVLGVLDRLGSSSFPGVFYAGTTTHGVWLRDRFSPVWAGTGETIIGTPSRISGERTDELLLPDVVTLPWPDASRQLIRKHVINTCLNPLATILAVPNGALLSSTSVRLIRQLCQEIQPLIPVLHPTWKPGVEELVAEVINVAELTRNNRNSMWVDYDAGRRGEVDSILGFWVTKAEELGTDVSIVRFLYELVRFKEEAKGLRETSVGVA